MFEKGDLVIYGTKGVCSIEDIRVPDIEGIDRMYYFLQPVYDKRDMVFTPVDSKKVNMRKILSDTEAVQFLEDIEQDPEIFDDRINSVEYNEVMRSGDCKRMAHLIKDLYKRKKGCAIRGKKMKYTDTKVLREAEKLLYGELATALHKTYEETFEAVRPLLYK